MRHAKYERFDPLLPDDEADRMLRLCERFGRYGMYSTESIEDDFGTGLTQRHDALLNFIRTGGRFGRQEPLEQLAARTNYFRETYAYDTPIVDGIEPFLRLEAFHEAARKIHGRPIVEPNIVYANILVPGQELAQVEADLAEAVAFEPEHVSAYALTVEPGTPYARGVSRAPR